MLKQLNRKLAKIEKEYEKTPEKALIKRAKLFKRAEKLEKRINEVKKST